MPRQFSLNHKTTHVAHNSSEHETHMCGFLLYFTGKLSAYILSENSFVSSPTKAHTTQTHVWHTICTLLLLFAMIWSLNRAHHHKLCIFLNSHILQGECRHRALARKIFKTPTCNACCGVNTLRYRLVSKYWLWPLWKERVRDQFF